MKLLILITLLWASTVHAAPVVIGTPVTANSGASAALSLTFAAVCPSGNTNVVAVACLAVKRAGAAAVTVTSVTYNGVAMSLMGETADGGSTSAHAALYRLNSPTCAGASLNTVITLNTTSQWIVGGMLFLKDVNLADPHDTVVSARGTASSVTVDVPSVTGDLVVDCAAARNSATNLVVGAGQTGLVNQTTNATANQNVEGAQSYEAGAATVTMSYTESATSIGWATIAASFNPAVVAGTRRRNPPRHYMLLDRFIADMFPVRWRYP
jgi:hypothetical protein